LTNKLYKRGKNLQNSDITKEKEQYFNSISSTISKLSASYNVTIDPYPFIGNEAAQVEWINNIKK
jgi:hypothetical protein